MNGPAARPVPQPMATYCSNPRDDDAGRHARHTASPAPVVAVAGNHVPDVPLPCSRHALTIYVWI
ncbi:hypothetical protein CFR76_01720 [Komagataeibacter swingsii]|uniref:Uncharacterized protein n=1 Tax=Komagataeibacter swingsii TaxID=215220 RepID=A0A2V4R901_9PROT|nr:hypothetical protein CFR76_01720 [Komagataeibacter swingsii]